MATKRPRYMISVDDEMFNAIEDFRFENRFQTRSEATAELIRLGLEALNKDSNKSKFVEKGVDEKQLKHQNNLEEMSMEELEIEKIKAETEYIKSISNSAKKTNSTVLHTTTDTQNLKNENIDSKVSNQ